MLLRLVWPWYTQHTHNAQPSQWRIEVSLCEHATKLKPEEATFSWSRFSHTSWQVSCFFFRQSLKKGWVKTWSIVPCYGNGLRPGIPYLEESTSVCYLDVHPGPRSWQMPMFDRWPSLVSLIMEYIIYPDSWHLWNCMTILVYTYYHIPDAIWHFWLMIYHMTIIYNHVWQVCQYNDLKQPLLGMVSLYHP